MKVSTDETIREIETGKMLNVDIGFDSEKDAKSSSQFDFLATYSNRAGVTADGQEVYANRGFRLIDEGVTWERIDNKEACLWCKREDNIDKMVNNATMNDGFSLWYHEACLEKLKDKTGQ